MSSEDEDISEVQYHAYNTHGTSNGDIDALQSCPFSCVNNNWLEIPLTLMEPKVMCAVNQFTHIVSEVDETLHSTDCELVLFGSGSSIPEHFRWLIYCVHMINNSSSIKGCFVPVKNKTRGMYISIGKQTAKTKNYDFIGIERLISGNRTIDTSKRKNMPKTLTPKDTFSAACSRLTMQGNAQLYARMDLVQLHWGLIPVEYVEHGEIKRKVFQILRAVPQPGFHLMELIRKRFFQKKHDLKSKEAIVIGEVCHYLQQIVNYEADINYGMQGVWNSALPSPWSVTDPVNPTSVQRLLSPFTVFKRLLHHIPGGHCGAEQIVDNGFDDSSLCIDGFPLVNSPEALDMVYEEYERRQELYLNALRNFELDFHSNIATCMREPDKELDLRPILSNKGHNYNLLNPKLNMIFTLSNFMKFAKEPKVSEMDRITIPKLGIAVIDLFLFFETNAIMSHMQSLDFIAAHVGEHATKEIVTETKIAMKYRVTDVQSLEDFPKAGQLKSARDGYKRNAIKLMQEIDCSSYQVNQRMVEYYNSYLRLQFTATTNGLLMDTWMSDRVIRCATIVNELVGDLCPCKLVNEALAWAWDEMPIESKKHAQCLMHDEIVFTWARLNNGLCVFNRTIKANPLNLAIVWGMLKSDVLTFLGLHNQTWRWIMFCMQIAPCFGHLRTQTEDGHAARGECILTAKPNSVGLNEVIIKTVNYCLEGLLSCVVALTDEDRRVLRLDKVDRKTRAGMEASQGVELANGRIIGKPTSSNLMQAVAVDEALRSFDESALAALINTGLPRDSNAGEGGTTKLLKPDKGYFEKGETRQLPGMGWYVLIFATNTNAHNNKIAEMLKTLACGAMITVAPGAPQSQGLASTLTSREKRKRGQSTKSSVSMGESMLPSDAHHGKMLAFLLSVPGIFSRQLGLINKTGQSNWEISLPVLQYVDFVKQYFFEHFSSFVSANYAQSCDRQFKGFIARSVAACLMCTTLTNLEQYTDTTEANFNSLKCMESSALTLYWANMALLNGITHLADSSLCIVNQLIRWKLNVPVINIDFLCDALDPDIQLDENCTDFRELRRFLERLRNARAREEGTVLDDPCQKFTGSYVCVPGVGSSTDYGHVENYLLRYCGMNLGLTYTYLKMFKDASHRSLDVTNVLDLPFSMLDVRHLFRRLEVRYEDHWYTPPGTTYEKGTNYLILIPDNTDTKGVASVGTVWAHVVQVLLVTALLGPVELHADNSIALGKGLFNLIAKRVLPQHAIPSTALMCETFAYKYGDVCSDVVHVKCERDYFYRPRICYSAWRQGKLKDMNCVVGNHPLEDVIHIHAWVQLHYMHCGQLPSFFYFMPGMVARGAELVPGRIYPVLSESDDLGVICLCPEGQAFALLKMHGCAAEALRLEHWQLALYEKNLQVAPLICRRHAVIKLHDGMIGLVVEQGSSMPSDVLNLEPEFNVTIHPTLSPRNYLDFDCKYQILVGDDEYRRLTFPTVHKQLLALGTHIAVKKNIVGINIPKDRNASNVETRRAKLPAGNYEYVIGWLRYPDDCDNDYRTNTTFFIAFRMTTYANEFEDICVISLPVECCVLVNDDIKADSVDHLVSNAT